MRHHPDGLLLVPVRAAVAVEPGRRSWRAWVVFPAGLAVLAAALASLLAGASLIPAAETGSCPKRTSVATYAGGQELLVRQESATGGITLMHLCADQAIGPVRDWTVRIVAGRAAGEAVAVQRVADGEALAAASLAPGRRSTVFVMLVPESGQPLAFVTALTAR